MTPGGRCVEATHGAGGELAAQFLAEHILTRFPRTKTGSIGLDALDDGATLTLPAEGELVVTTDSHVVKPVFFPGGDIGRLAAAGTINDLAVMGARPLALTLSLVLEEGFPLSDLATILDSFAAALAEAGTSVICGDTKVMGRGEIDGIAINTAGVGIACPPISDVGFSPGDSILVTGTIGDHGMALLLAREEFHLRSDLRSDVAPIWSLIARALEVGGIHAMKDPTRGGLAAALNEMARKSQRTIDLEENAIPFRQDVLGLSAMIGIAPTDVANEGKAILAVAPNKAAVVLEALRAHPLGRDAAVIGTVTESHPGRVILNTTVGGRRFMEMPLGDPVPRIC